MTNKYQHNYKKKLLRQNIPPELILLSSGLPVRIAVGVTLHLYVVFDQLTFLKQKNEV